MAGEGGRGPAAQRADESILTLRRREFIAAIAGTAVAWPIGASAQQKAIPVIGFLGATSPAPQASSLAAFLRGLSEAGYVETKNLTIEYRWAENHFDRLPTLAADLVSRKVNLIVTFGGPTAALAAKRATSKIPIVFNAVGDPIASGLVGSLAHPGGNVTGFSILVVELNTKRFELLSELIPTAKIIALLVNPNTASSERVVHEVRDAARTKRIQLVVLGTATQSEVAVAFDTMQQRRVDALLVSSDPSFNNWREQLVALASRYRVPAIYEFSEFVEIGGLASYGPNLLGINHQAGIYAGRVLNGENPAELPVQQPTSFELAINLKTASALGLTVSPLLLAGADKVVE
jgi:putative ABC transport system substrate-binding protein